MSRCAEHGCRLGSTPGSRFLILKGEIADPAIKMCDCLVFGSDGRLVIVELKNTAQHAG